MNLIDLFRINLISRSDQPAIRFEDRAFTYGDLDAWSNRIAHAFVRLGLQKGDRVAFYLNNSLELVLTYLANLKLGLVTVPMNVQYRDVEIARIISDATPRVILTDKAQWPTLERARGQCPFVPRILLAEGLDKLVENESSSEIESRVDTDDLAAIMYTSGTTGRSKGAVLTHGNFVSNITGIVVAWQWTSADALLLTLPLYHMHGLGVALHGTLTTGCTMVLQRGFQARQVLDDLSNGSTTLFMGVPTMYVRLVEEARRRSIQQTSLPQIRLFVSGSAPLSVETFQDFERIFGHRILERYGMTETAMNLSNPYCGPRIPGTVGVPLPGVSARIVDDSGALVPDGEIGEVQIRGSNVFQGYWQLPEKTAQAFMADLNGNRWFRTGDLAKRDPRNGVYTLAGRKHDMIISGGFNIYPREVEDLLMQHPAVLEAAVIGVPDRAKGELPVAFVVFRDGVTASDEELLEHCGAHLARFKIPRTLTVLTALPRNAMGKVDKSMLPRP